MFGQNGHYFVNREHPLALIWQIIQQEVEQCLLLVVGPSGIGKSSLLDESQDRCIAAGIDYVRVDFRETLDQGYLSFIQRVREQLGAAGFERLDERLAQSHTWGHWQATNRHANTSKADTEPVTPASVMPGRPIYATVGDVGTEAQVVVGDYNKVIRANVVNDITVLIQQDDPRVRTAVQLEITDAFLTCLREYASERKVVFFLDSWDAGRPTTDVRDWLNRTLFQWLLTLKLPNTVAIIAGSEEPTLGRSSRWLERLKLAELDQRAVHTYWTDKRGLPATEVADIIKYSGGIPVVMALIANHRALTIGQP